MHPILIELATPHFLVLGALVATMLVWSHWTARPPEKRTIGSLVALLVLGALAGAVGGWVASTRFDPHHPPKIHTFGPLVALGSFLGIVYIRREGARRGFDPEVLTGLAVEVLLVGVAGSRVLFVAITPEAFRHDPQDGFLYSYVIQYLALWNGGLVWYGGLIPAALYALWRGKKLGLPWRTVADIFAPAVMLGLAIGRIGCLMAGDDHGKLSPDGQPHWWTLTFTDKDALVMDSLRGKPLWPSQPMMSIGDFIIFSACHSVRKKLQDRPIAVTLVMFTLYPILRFFIEIIRGDAVRKFLVPFSYEIDPRTGDQIAVTGLSTSQAISIVIVPLAIGLLIYILRTPPRGVEKPGPQSALKTEEPAALEAQPVAAAAPAAAPESPEKPAS